MVRQLEIYKVSIEASHNIVSERLVVVLQSNLSNAIGKNTVIAPINSGFQGWPYAINLIPTRENGLGKKSHINLNDIQTMQISKLHEKVGELEKVHLKDIKTAIRLIQIVFDH